MSHVDFCSHCRAEIAEKDKKHIYTAADGKSYYVCDKCHNTKRGNIITAAQRLFNKIILGI